MRSVIAALTVILIAGVAAAGTTRKVPQDFPTIQAAVDAADPGDTILVSKRTGGAPYDEKVSTSKSLKFIGKRVVWDGVDSKGSYERPLTVTGNSQVNGVLVKGFTFRNGSEHIYIYGNDAVVQSCTFRNAYGTAVRADGSGARVQKCGFRGNGRGVEINGSSGTVDRNTLFAHNNGTIYITGSSAVVTKNKVSRNGFSYGVLVDGSGASVSGNTVVDGSSGIYVSGDDGTVEKNKVSRCMGGWTGIDYYGRGGQVLSNQISTVGGSGVYFDGQSGSSETASLIEGNVIRGCNGYGVSTYQVDVTIRGNSISRTSNSGIYAVHYVSDTNSVITLNSITDAFSYGIYVQGGGWIIDGNQIRQVSSSGIYCNGDEYQGANAVTNNVIQGFSQQGIYMDAGYGPGFTATGNQISDGIGNATGIYVYAYLGGVGTVNGNRISGVPGDGIYIYGDQALPGTHIDGNTISGTGVAGNSGIYSVYTPGVHVAGNTINGAIHYGINIYAPTGPNEVSDNKLKGCERGGILVGGSGFTVTGNSAFDGDGEGFVNFAGGTIFTGNTFKGFRLDVANAGNFATPAIEDVNTFQTGGAGTFPQVNGL